MAIMLTEGTTAIGTHTGDTTQATVVTGIEDSYLAKSDQNHQTKLGKIELESKEIIAI